MSDSSAGLQLELAKLRKAVLRQGHSLDMVRERTDEGLSRVEARLGGVAER